MKKTLFILACSCLATSFASAAISLKYQYNFTDLNGQVNSVKNVAVPGDYCTPGTASISVASGSYINYNNSTASYGKAYVSNNSKLRLGTTSTTTDIGVGTENGFSISFAVAGTASEGNELMKLFDATGNDFSLRKGETDWVAKNWDKTTSTRVTSEDSFALSTNVTDMSSVILTFCGTEAKVYINGELAATIDNLTLGNVSYIDFAPTTNVTLDEIQIYDGVLNADEIARLAADPTTPVPEPTTTTLSLLALAGLMARRRRVA